MRSVWQVCGFVALVVGTAMPATAREIVENGVGTAFTGAYAGPEFGAHEHHFYIAQTNLQTGETRGRYYRAWGAGGGAFAGYELPVARRLRIGVELGVSVGGNAPIYREADGTSYSRQPTWGLRGTGRVGYVLGNNVLAYGTFGYGDQRYDRQNTARVTNTTTWHGSFTIGAGFEYRLSRRAGVRLDFRHLDNSMSHILIGVPVRF